MADSMPSALHSQRPRHSQGGVQAVFMEAIEPISSAKVSAIPAADIAPAGLRLDGIVIVERMMVHHAALNLSGVDTAIRVQRYTIVFRNRKRLQAVHVISERRAGATVRAQAVIPGSPRLESLGQQSGIGMQADVISAGGKSRQNVPLAIAGGFEQRQDLIAVTREDYLVEAHRRAISKV